MTLHRSLIELTGLCLVLWVGLLGSGGVGAQVQSDNGSCGNVFVARYGPFDYRTATAAQRNVVEQYHFDAGVESLIKGMTGSVHGDINYTLNAFPNHPRALIAMMNLRAKMKVELPTGAPFTFECYFIRAVTFRPDDAIARIIYAKYLAANGRKADAMQHLVVAADQAKDNAFTQYNIGLVYLELGAFDKALIQAHRAMALDFGRLELKQKLVAAGKWVDPPPPAAAEPASAAASGPA